MSNSCRPAFCEYNGMCVCAKMAFAVGSQPRSFRLGASRLCLTGCSLKHTSLYATAFALWRGCRVCVGCGKRQIKLGAMLCGMLLLVCQISSFLAKICLGHQVRMRTTTGMGGLEGQIMQKTFFSLCFIQYFSAPQSLEHFEFLGFQQTSIANNWLGSGSF